MSVWRGFSVAVPGSVAHSVDQLLYCILTTPHRLLALTAHLQSIACFVVFGTVFVFYFLRTFQPSRAGAVQVSAPECILAQGRLLLMTFLATQRSLFLLDSFLRHQVKRVFLLCSQIPRLTGNPGERTFYTNICHHRRASESGTPRIYLQFLEL